MNKLLYVLLFLGGLAILYGVGAAWKLKPETKYNHTLHTGETAVVTNKTGGSVWMALDQKDCYAIGVAMSNLDKDYLSAAENNKTAFVVPIGTLVKVLGESESRVKGEVMEGPLAGKQGWLEFEFLRARKAGEFR